MTEEQWLASSEPVQMLQFMRTKKASDRKLRLFACSCQRHVAHLYKERRIGERTIEFAERFADGQQTRNELHGCAWGKAGEANPVVAWTAREAATSSCEHAAGRVANVVLQRDGQLYTAWQVACVEAWLQRGHHLSEAIAIADASMPEAWVTTGREAKHEEYRYQCSLLRDIFGNPFQYERGITCLNAGRVFDLATAVYNNRRFADVRILADLLDEANWTAPLSWPE